MGGKEVSYIKITIDNEFYPENLKNISSPPKELYCSGNLELLKSEKILGIVGTRRPTSYGRIACERIVKDISKAGITIVSGLAMGIDGVCHRKTLECGGKTIAVVGSGLDVVYPMVNYSLWKDIEKKGLIISEFPLGTKPYPQNFPLRNRIIAGLSKGVVVIESKEKGGSLITAELALEENRDVFALPGEIFSDYSKGCNNLIKNSKAKLIMNAKDILEDYAWECEYEEINQPFNSIEGIILEHLNKEKSLDYLINITKIDAKTLLSILMEMEINGFIKSLPGGKYKKIN